MFTRIYNTIFVLFIKIHRCTFSTSLLSFYSLLHGSRGSYIKKITSRQMSPLNGAHQIKFRILFHRLIRLMWCIEFLIFTKVEKQVCNFFLTTTNQISYYCSKNMWAAKGKKKKDQLERPKYYQ